ncbi:uncharacterized protein [Chiloscyllium punctatum]
MQLVRSIWKQRHSWQEPAVPTYLPPQRNQPVSFSTTSDEEARDSTEDVVSSLCPAPFTSLETFTSGFCSCIYYQNIRCVNMDVSTQEILDEIRTSQEQGDDGNLFYLYVATPGGAPKDIHKKLIKPFLQERGWQKVSYPNTGFRALYFCHKKSDGLEKAEAVRDRAELKNKLDEYKELNKVDFKVHMVLSIPVNYNEDFVELTSQPGSIEW